MKKKLFFQLLFIFLILSCATVLAVFDEYAFRMDYTFENESGVAYSGPIPFWINPDAMIDYGFMQDDARDILGATGNTEINVTARDLTSTDTAWRFPYSVINPNYQVSRTLYFGDINAGTDSRNQGLIASRYDTGIIYNTGSLTFSGTDSFVILAEVTPSCIPECKYDLYSGTVCKGIILQKNNSYELAINQAMEYVFTLWDGVGTKTVRLDAEIGTQANLYAWYNGIATPPEMVLCDSISSLCDSGTISTLQSSASNIIHAECSAFIDNIIIRTPDFPNYTGGTPMGTGGISINIGEMAYSEPNSDICCTNWCNSDTGEGNINYYAQGLLDSNIRVDISDDTFADSLDNLTHRYGGYYKTGENIHGYYVFDGVNGVEDDAYSPDQELSAIWLNVDIEYLCDRDHGIQLGIYNPDDKYGEYYYFPVIEQYNNVAGTVINYKSGSRTIAPSGATWRISDLNEYYYVVYISSWEGLTSCASSTCPDVGGLDFYIADFEVIFDVAND